MTAVPPVVPRVVVVDDNTVVRRAFGVVHEGLDVVASHATVEEYLAAPAPCDVVLLDLRLRGAGGAVGPMQGRPAIRALTDLGRRVCLYTDESRPLVLALCLRSGAHGVAHKSDPPELVTEAVRRVAQGDVVVTPSLVELTEVLDRRAALDLTDRQRDTVAGRARGRSWRDIARSLHITESVAREHYSAACTKLRDFLQGASAADIERALGIGPDDVLGAG
ncbi:response regulator transcription factor [Nocardioides sp. GY 10127]|uniref:response regulator transcription factor n=1 Tax=Nocardioides sp. GY 10127 TaxID=2569762 RepID=UPI0010A84C7D|nr:response regulator transcription factor [Nocardioides sp. GY 10127]TIC79458.1 response regulator transcription factor [Nocardioides sp. GY 10127]